MIFFFFFKESKRNTSRKWCQTASWISTVSSAFLTCRWCPVDRSSASWSTSLPCWPIWRKARSPSSSAPPRTTKRSTALSAKLKSSSPGRNSKVNDEQFFATRCSTHFFYTPLLLVSFLKRFILISIELVHFFQWIVT